MVDNLTIIKPYNKTHYLKIILTGNKNKREPIPSKNLTPSSTNNLNRSSVN